MPPPPLAPPTAPPAHQPSMRQPGMVHFQAQHGARSPRSLGTSAAFLLLGFVVSGGLLLLLTGSGGVQRQLSSAAAAAARSVRVCPEPVCPDCPATLRKAAGGAATQQQAQQQQHRQQWHHDEPPPDEQQQQPDEHQEQQQADAPEPLGDGAGGTAGGAAAAAGVPLLCGGPDSVPSVQDSLAQAAAALEASLDASFEPFSKGFTLEDLMETAHRLGVDGSHDTQVWVEVSAAGGARVRRWAARGSRDTARGDACGGMHCRRCCRSECCCSIAPMPVCRPAAPWSPQIRNQTVVFPRRENMKCTWFCNGAQALQRLQWFAGCGASPA